VRAKVSEIPVYSACPARLKLLWDGKSLWGDEKRQALHTVRKEWAFRYHIALASTSADTSSIRESLLDELSWLRENISHIHPDIAQEGISQATDELLGQVDSVAQGLGALAESGGRWMVEPVKIQQMMYSDELGLGGMLDKLVESGEGGVIPSIIRTGGAPSTGVWENDRLQATGYALLLEEEGDSIRNAQVEYASTGIVRRFPIRPSDRRECLRCVEGIHALAENGRARANYRVCKRCPLRDECPSTGTLLSKLLERL